MTGLQITLFAIIGALLLASVIVALTFGLLRLARPAVLGHVRRRAG